MPSEPSTQVLCGIMTQLPEQRGAALDPGRGLTPVSPACPLGGSHQLGGASDPEPRTLAPLTTGVFIPFLHHKNVYYVFDCTLSFWQREGEAF